MRFLGDWYHIRVKSVCLCVWVCNQRLHPQMLKQTNRQRESVVGWLYCIRDDYYGSVVIHDQTDGVIHQASCALFTKPRSITLSSFFFLTGQSVSGPLLCCYRAPRGGCWLMLRGGRGVCVWRRNTVESTRWWMYSLRIVYSTDCTQKQQFEVWGGIHLTFHWIHSC